jgi:hypothetical protein
VISTKQRYQIHHWPIDRKIVRLIIWDGANGFGEFGIDALWWQGETPRGQVFRSTLESHEKRWRGRTIQVVYPKGKPQ